MTKVFVLGNGESRKSFNLDALKKQGAVYGCNALYRDFAPDTLVCIDGGMQHEVYTSGYALENKCYFRTWSKLPVDAYYMMVDQTTFGDDGHTVQNNKQGRTEFVMNGTDPNQMRQLYEYHINKGTDKTTVDELLSKHHRWITWTEENDCVYVIPEDYSSWSAGPTAVRLALEEEIPDEVYLIGFDMGSQNGLVNNVYKGTDNYLSNDAAVTPSVNWINQHANNFKDYPNVIFYKVNPAPLGTDDTCQFIEEWKDYDNLQYIEADNLQLSIDFGWMM